MSQRKRWWSVDERLMDEKECTSNHMIRVKIDANVCESGAIDRIASTEIGRSVCFGLPSLRFVSPLLVLWRLL